MTARGEAVINIPRVKRLINRKLIRLFRSILPCSITRMDYHLVLVPPSEAGNLAKNFAEKIASVLKISVFEKLRKRILPKLQKFFQNSVLKRDNAIDVFSYSYE